MLRANPSKGELDLTEPFTLAVSTAKPFDQGTNQQVISITF